MDISKYIQDIDAEILGEKQDLIKKAIDEQLKNFVFDEHNISPNLKTLFMPDTRTLKTPLFY